MSDRYNLQSMVDYWDYKNVIRLRKPMNYYTKEEIEEAHKNPCIYHLSNTFLIKGRAWYKETNHPRKEIFKAYKNMTPWKDFEYKDNRKITKRIFEAIVSIMPRFIVAHFFNIIYNNVRVSLIAKKRKKKHE